ncbi:MAG: carboxypeptidase regulatory-like domain-containing protein [Oscillospiraceae bacterium]|nr:carboxypeptidase regulatory-like domain-containing protein [Oscillospiraceae bacterium]
MRIKKIIGLLMMIITVSVFSILGSEKVNAINDVKTIPLQYVFGQVTSKQTGKIISGATVVYKNNTNVYTATTNASGYYSMNVLPSQYTVTANYKGYKENSNLITIKNDKNIKRFDIKLESNTVAVSSFTVSGRVTDARTGSFVNGAYVNIKNADKTYSTTTDNNGYYKINSVISGNYTATSKDSTGSYSMYPESLTITLNTVYNIQLFAISYLENQSESLPTYQAAEAELTKNKTTYGGMYIDNNGILNVMVQKSGNVKDYQAIINKYKKPGQIVIYHIVSYSLDYLQSIQDKLDFNIMGKLGIYSSYIDVITNTIVIGYSDAKFDSQKVIEFTGADSSVFRFEKGAGVQPD